MRLYRQGYTRQEVIDLFTFIDWVMKLPPELEDNLWERLKHEEKEMKMPYITSVEQIGRKKGKVEGTQNILSLLMMRKFRLDYERVAILLSGLNSSELEELGDSLLEMKNIAEVEETIRKIKEN